MPSARLTYFWFCISTICIGILSRQINIIPLFVGDVLYSCLIYFGFRFLFPNQRIITSSLLTLLFCFSIEFSQLYKAIWLVNLRSTLLGHYILGQGFLFTDLICYIMGAILASWIDKAFKTQNSL